MTTPTVADQAFLGSVFNWKNLGLLMNGDILPSLVDWRNRHGDVVRIRLGHHWTYLIAKPEDLSYALIENHKNFTKDTPGYRGLRDYLGDGLLSVHDTTKWAKMRKTVQPLFNRDQVLKQVPVFLKRAEALVRRLTTTLDEQVFDLSRAMTTITLGVLGECILNCELEDESSQINSDIRRAIHHATSAAYNTFALPTYIPTLKNILFRRTRRRLLETVKQIIAGQSHSTDKNLFTALNASPISDSEVYDEFVTMIQAGHETTANALNWAFVHLQENPDVLARVVEEVNDDAVFASYKGMESASYLHQVICESMRVDPAVWAFDRRAVQAVAFGGHSIPANSFILISPYVTHRHPDYWPEPDRFDPSRFAPENVKSRPRLAFLPFGAGPRVCIGQQFALMEMKVIMANLMRHGTIYVLNSDTIRRDPSVTLRPKGPLWARFIPRRSSYCR